MSETWGKIVTLSAQFSRVFSGHAGGQSPGVFIQDTRGTGA